jgi:predicted short-subunit dehydrogenase-like oxidoreductase (DUF2520 family)
MLKYLFCLKISSEKMFDKEHIAKIVMIGAGNVGTHLGKALRQAGLEIMQVYSRDPGKAKVLALELESTPCHKLSEIFPTADLYVLAVHDDAIGEVSRTLKKVAFHEQLFVHTSGATPLDVICQKRRGVLYPLQTFTVGREPDFREIPICLDAAFDQDLQMLTYLAKRISHKVFHLTDEQRSVVHVAAVFANNFSNHMFHIAKDILDQEGLPFALLEPLIKETAGKLEQGNPKEMQTGPAIRRDDETIDRHLAYLKNLPRYRAIYELLTKSIQQT